MAGAHCAWTRGSADKGHGTLLEGRRPILWQIMWWARPLAAAGLRIIMRINIAIVSAPNLAPSAEAIKTARATRQRWEAARATSWTPMRTIRRSAEETI